MATDLRTRPIPSRRDLAAVCGAVLTLGVVAGLGAWQLGGHGHRGGRTTTTPVQAQVQQQPAVQVNPLPTVSSARAVPQHESVIYLVNSDTEADQLRAAMAFISDPMQALDAQIVVLPTDAPVQRDGLDLMLNAANEERSLQGLPPVQLIDLRLPPATTTDRAGSAGAVATVTGVGRGECRLTRA
jgi:hypothetical protein